MINVLGFKRLVAIGVILLINALLAAALYAYLQPQNISLERELRTTRSQIAAKRSEISRLRLEYEQIQEEKVFFEGLENAGFFSDQNRVLARRRMQDIIKQSNVLVARYDITPRRRVQNEKAQEAEYVELNSDISVNFDAMDDVDFYNFIYLVENAFPGQTSVKELRINRLRGVNDAVLREIGSGGQPVLVQGKMDFSWKTIMPLTELEAQDDGRF